MNNNRIRALVVALSTVVIPNVASAYYAAHMGRWTSRDPIADRIGGPSGQESSVLPGHMGRFTTRDAFGGIGHIGLGLMPGAESDQLSARERRPTGWMLRDPKAGSASDFNNLYEYVLSNPLTHVDASGLQSIGPILPPDRSCFYYKARCNEARWWDVCAKFYYCAAARFFCNITPEGGWNNCMRECLQCRDGERRLNDTPIVGTLAGCLQAGLESGVGDHTICFIKCLPKWGSPPPPFP